MANDRKGAVKMEHAVVGESKSEDGGRVYTVKRSGFMWDGTWSASYFQYEVGSSAITVHQVEGPNSPAQGTAQVLLRLPPVKGTTWISPKEKAEWEVVNVDLTLETQLGTRTGCIAVIGRYSLAACEALGFQGAQLANCVAEEDRRPTANVALRNFCPGLGVVAESNLTIQGGKVVNDEPLTVLVSAE